MKLSSRKFIVTVMIFMVSAVLLWFGRIDQSAFKGIAEWIFLGYVIGNVAAAKIANGKS